jgi:subtilase family serine protease
VVGVGGTSLTRNGSTWSEVAWSGCGGEVSAYETEPALYMAFTASFRGIPDVAFDADPNTGVVVYDSTPAQGSAGWFVVGGTSLGTHLPGQQSWRLPSMTAQYP